MRCSYNRVSSALYHGKAKEAALCDSIEYLQRAAVRFWCASRGVGSHEEHLFPLESLHIKHLEQPILLIKVITLRYQMPSYIRNDMAHQDEKRGRRVGRD